MRNRGLLAVGATAIVTAAYLAAFTPARSRPAVEAAHEVRLTRTDAVNRVRPIVSNLWPSRPDVVLTPELTVIADGMTSPRDAQEVLTAAWLVACEDDQGNPIGTITIDAVSGEVLSIVAGSGVAAKEEKAFPEMATGEARGVLRQWIDTLAGANDHAWRETEERRQAGAYVTTWRSGHRVVHLSIRSRTGALSSIHVARMIH